MLSLKIFSFVGSYCCLLWTVFYILLVFYLTLLHCIALFKVSCCILAQFLYLGKILFLRYRPKCSRPSDCRIFKSTISVEPNDEKIWFFACCYKLIKIKSWLKNVGVVKNGWGHSGPTTLKLAVSQEGINGVNWFWMVLMQIQES